MPVIPNNVPTYTIRAPTTTGDKGGAGRSILRDTERVFALIEDERHLVAQRLYKSVLRRILDWERQHSRKPSNGKGRFRSRAAQETKEHFEAEDCATARKILAQNKAVIDKLENRCRIFQTAQRNLNIDEDWTFASLHFGITTYYRREHDGSLSIKLEGEITGVPLFEQIAVLRDVDLHQNWVPFCTASKIIADLDKLDLVGWFMVGIPQIGLARDGCFRVIGCDNMSEDGSILIAGQGVNDIPPNGTPPENPYLSDDPIMSRLDIPPPPTKRANGRMTIRRFETVVHVISPTAANTRIVANINPNIAFLSQAIIDFALKHLAGVMLNRLQVAAKKVVKYPATNEHAQKMRQESAFYQKWLMAKFKGFCDERGWSMPTVAAFALNEEYVLSSRYNGIQADGQKGISFGDVQEIKDKFDISSIDNEFPKGSRIEEDTDSVSEITTRSTLSMWRNNPVSKYLRAKEEITKQKKEAKIAEVRQRVNDLIKPRQLSFEQQERLEELRYAKQKRLAEQYSSEPSAASASNASATSDMEFEKLTIIQRVTARFHKHNSFTRTSVLAIVICLLLIMLNPEVPYKLLLSRVVARFPNTVWMAWVWDIAVVCYIMMCTVVHACLCDICLVYAYAGLELGGKSGGTLKRYYGKNVQLGVLIMSLIIMCFSLGKATVRAILYLFLWSISQVSSIAQESATQAAAGFDMDGTLAKTEFMLEASELKVAPHLLSAYRWSREAFAVVSTSVSVAWHYFPFKNTAVGSVLKVVHATWERFLSLMSHIVAFVFQATSDEAETNPHIRWRQEAFETSKVLITYTAMFLVTAVSLFFLTSKNSSHVSLRRTNSNQKIGKNKETVASSGGVLKLPPKDIKTIDRETRRMKKKYAGMTGQSGARSVG